MNKFFFIVYLFAFFKADATIFPASQGPTSLGLGSISCFKNDPFVAYNHCGNLAFSSKNLFSMAVQSQYFVEGLNTTCFSLNKKINHSQTGGIGYSYFGNSNYNESLLKLSFANKFNKSFGAGVSVDYLRLQLPSSVYRVKNLLTFEVGIYNRFNSNVDLALLFINPIRARVSNYQDERLPFIINASALIQNNTDLVFGIEWNQRITETGSLRLGLKYKVNKKLDINLGMHGKPFNPTLGINYYGKRLGIQISTSLHPYLNTVSSSGISIGKSDSN